MNNHSSTRSGDMIFEGCFVHATATQNMAVCQSMVLGVRDGKIQFFEPKSKLASLLKQFEMNSGDVHVLAEDQFIMPGFVDSHAHASQFSFMGTGNDLELLPWLQKYTYPTEAQLTTKSDLARDVYEKCVARTLKNGTTTISYFATIDRLTTMTLVDILESQGQRAYIGKVNMDKNSPDNYQETCEQSLAETRRFITEVLDRKNPLLTPCITPRFAVTCSEELMVGLGDLAKEFSLPVQTHISENADEIGYIHSLFPTHSSYADVYDSVGLLTPKTILAHGVHLTDAELDIIKIRGSGVSHCPNSNFSLKSGVMDVRRLMSAGVKLGLGTDFAGGNHSSMLDAIRNGFVAANVTAERMSSKGLPVTSVTHEDMFRLATLGSCQVMGLDDKIGNFEVGKEFDAIVVDPVVSNGPFDVFPTDDIDDVIQKFIFLGDDRNINSVYVQGKKVLSAPTQ